MERASRSAVGVGTAAIVLNKEGQILVGLRKGSHGEGESLLYYRRRSNANLAKIFPSSSSKGTWGLPGGHIEFGEGTHYCAEREVYEETGLEVKAVKFAGSTNDYFEEAGKHYITNFVVTTMKRYDAMPRV